VPWLQLRQQNDYYYSEKEKWLGHAPIIIMTRRVLLFF
jgi:hypothetical protein